jgi:hypothetical protein
LPPISLLDITRRQRFVFVRHISPIMRFPGGKFAYGPLGKGKAEPRTQYGKWPCFCIWHRKPTGVSDVERKAGTSFSSSLHTFGRHVV